jgi:hypothetical protein
VTPRGGWRRRNALTKASAKRRPSRGGEKDAIAILKEDYERVRGLLAELEKTTTEKAGSKDVFYPAFFDACQKSDDKEL